MRFLYATASLALFAATAQAFSTGSPVCKSDDATLGKIAKAGKMGKQVDTNTFADSWAFQLWDEEGKQVDGDSIMTNMDYWVTVNGGDYKGVMVYPMFDGQRVPVAKQDDIVSLSPGDDDNFQIAGKCAKTDGVTVTHTNPDDKSGDAKVAKVRVMDENAGKFMLSGVVVTAKSTFGKAVTPQYELVAGQDNNSTDGGDDNGDDNGGDNGDDNGDDNGGNGGDATNGGTGTGGDGNTPADDGANGASSISFVRSAVALIALAAFMLI